MACVLVGQEYSLHSRLKTKPTNFAYVLSKTIDGKTEDNRSLVLAADAWEAIVCAYTGFAYSVPSTTGGEYQREGYRVDLGLYPIGESPFLISAGFSENQTSEKKYESVHIKGIHPPICYVLIGHRDGSLEQAALNTKK